MNKLLKLTLIAFLLLIPATTFAASFIDVSSSHQHYEAIEFLKQKGTIDGYGDGSFKPNGKVSRAEALKMILLAGDVDIGDSGWTPFSDVDSNAWFARFINAATSENIINGYEDGSFKPGNNVNLAEALKMSFQSFDMSGLPDGSNDQWYAPYADFAASNNITWQEFNPGKEITRAELAELLYRFHKTANPFNGYSIIEAARKQIGVVTKYDTSYYSGGYPPADSGACTDVIENALRVNGYDLKAKIDDDMWRNSSRYPYDSDPNINYRRVVNVRIFLEHHAQSVSTCTDAECFEEEIWQPGDIVTYNQMEGGLWHIAIISDQKTWDGIPYLIHNGGGGVKEQNMLLTWPATISGHYRISL